MEPSAAIEERIRREAAKLERYSDRITGCRVVVEEPQRRHHQGNLFHIRIDLTLPGGELLVKRAPAEHHAHEDAYVAVRDAFNAARRRLQDHVRRQRHEVKLHEEQPEGRVARLVPAEDHGFIQAGDEHEVYFHRNSVLGNGFDALGVGSKVRFIEEDGDKGPQASTVIASG
jgi:cold shock CspA family protein